MNPDALSFSLPSRTSSTVALAQLNLWLGWLPEWQLLLVQLGSWYSVIGMGAMYARALAPESTPKFVLAFAPRNALAAAQCKVC